MQSRHPADHHFVSEGAGSSVATSEPEPDIRVGAVVDARILSRTGDTIFLSVDGGHVVRLLKEDSLAHQSEKPLDILAEYAEGNTVRVFLKRFGKTENGQGFLFGQERWAHSNPWPTLQETLQPDDRVTGVVRHIVQQDGYLVQLDPALPVCTSDGQPYRWDDAAGSGLVIQPDIEVYLPRSELPWANGSTASDPSPPPPGGRLRLHIGDAVALLLKDVTRQPPLAPTASLVALMHSQDVASQNRQHGQKSTMVSTATTLGRRQAQLAQSSQTDHDLAELAKQLQGKRIAVLDDAAEVRETLEVLLRHYGAEPEIITPPDEKGWQHESLVEALLGVFLGAPDLLLVDDGLPAIHEGERGLVRALALWQSRRAAEPSLPPAPRAILMSANTDSTERSSDELHQLGVFGAIRRPLHLQTVAQLLQEDAKPVWEWKPGEDSLGLNGMLPMASARSIDALLRRAMRDLKQDYAVMLTVGSGGSLHWLAASGRVPFGPADLHTLARDTDLRQLTAGLRADLTPKHGNTPTSLIYPNAAHIAHWHGLRLTPGRRPDYLVGVGSQSGQDCGAFWPWFTYAVRAKLESAQWQAALTQHASALASGWLAQGYAHESITRLEYLRTYTNLLADVVRRGRAAGGHVAVSDVESIAQALEKHGQQSEIMAQRLLKRQRSRAAPIVLKQWAEGLRPSLARQCNEAGVRLWFPEPPDVAVAVPELVLGIALSNLVLNAAKHHYREDNRWVEVLLRVDAKLTHVLCEVYDNGPGVSQEAQARLFEPGHSIAADPERRHGIGLWLSRLLVEQEGGSLNLVESYLGLGARFSLSLPMVVG